MNFRKQYDIKQRSVFKTVLIGKQIWTINNSCLKTYIDGTPIPHVTDSSQWSKLTTPAYCWYGDSTSISAREKWGALYNWYVVDPENPKQIAPDGWRVPSDADWTALENYLIANGYNWDGTTSENKIGKSLAAKTDWESSPEAGDVGNDMASNNRTGFSALPVGFRNSIGNFLYQSSNGYWWSASEFFASLAWHRDLGYGSGSLNSGGSDKSDGFSLRLVKDIGA